MASVHQLKDGRWYVQCNPGEHPEGKQREYFGRGEQARMNAIAFKVKITTRKRRETGKFFSDLANQYLSDKKKIKGLRPKSFDTAVVHLVKHIGPFFGHLDIAHISESTVLDYVDLRSTQRWKKGNTTYTGVSNTTIRRELGTFQAVLNHSVRKGYITHNPVQYVEKPPEDTEEIQPPTAAEYNAIYLHAVPHLKRFLMLAYFTGARPGESEILKFTWENVDFINGTIYVVSAKKKGPKKRNIHLHPTLFKNLEAWYQEDVASKYKPIRIIHYYGQGIKCILKAWNTAKRKAGVTRKLTPYSNRHAAITAMLESGADLKSVSQNVGHSTIRQTADRYQHASTNLKRDAIFNLPDIGKDW